MIRTLLYSIIQSLIQQETHTWFFITLSFPASCRELQKEDKIKHIRSFFTKCNKKHENFIYFWVQEGDEATVHAHAIINQNYSIAHMTSWWEAILHTAAPIAIHGGTPVESMTHVLDYMFKEKCTTYGMSGVWHSKSKILQNYITNNMITLINHQIPVHISVHTYIKGTVCKQLDMEQLMFENFINCSPDMMTWLDAFSHNFKGEKELFFSRLEPKRGGNVLKKYVDLLSKSVGEGWKSLLFYSLLYHVILMAYYELKVEQHGYTDKIKNILLSLLCNKKQVNNYLLSVPGEEERLAMDINTLFEQGFSEYFAFTKHINKMNSCIYKQISFKYEFKDLPLNPSYKDLHGWAPMLVQPKPWIMAQVNKEETDSRPNKEETDSRPNKEETDSRPNKEETDYFMLQDYVPGGYICNGVRFSRPLCKVKGQSCFEYLTQESLDCINYLQEQPMAINRNFLEYIQKSEQNIISIMFPKGIDIQQLEQEHKPCKQELDKLYHGVNAYIKDNFAHVNYDTHTAKGRKILEQLRRKTPQWDEIVKLTNLSKELDSYIDKVQKYNCIMSVSNFYAKYDKFYFCYEVDFRGRIYSVSDYLNYQGDDLARSLVYFYEESSMNLYWFKLYCVRKEGLRLEINSASEMITYFDNILHNKMVDFRNNSWWAHTDNPWSMLNCCLEYERYLLIGEPYLTGLPIYFDATCSGSQLISLLFKLDDYAASLNLKPSSCEHVMGDFYMEIIDKFRNHLEETCANNIEYFNIKSKLTNKKDWRKLLKRAIMTINYGLTLEGMKLKLMETNRELAQEHQLSLKCTIFMAERLYKYINTQVVFGNLEVLSYLTKQAAEENKHIQVYTNNSGYTMDKQHAHWSFKQHYNKQYLRVITTDKKIKDKQRLTSQITYKKWIDNSMDTHAQVLAVRANLIHNLDAVWLHNSIMRIKQEPNFAGVLLIHDCFGVLMKDILALNIHVRKALANFFSDKENLYKLALNLARDTSNKPERSLIENKLGDLQVNLQDSFYLIFPG